MSTVVGCDKYFWKHVMPLEITKLTQPKNRDISKNFLMQFSADACLIVLIIDMDLFFVENFSPEKLKAL